MSTPKVNMNKTLAALLGVPVVALATSVASADVATRPGCPELATQITATIEDVVQVGTQCGLVFKNTSFSKWEEWGWREVGRNGVGLCGVTMESAVTKPAVVRASTWPNACRYSKGQIVQSRLGQVDDDSNVNLDD